VQHLQIRISTHPLITRARFTLWSVTTTAHITPCSPLGDCSMKRIINRESYHKYATQGKATGIGTTCDFDHLPLKYPSISVRSYLLLQNCFLITPLIEYLIKSKTKILIKPGFHPTQQPQQTHRIVSYRDSGHRLTASKFTSLWHSRILNMNLSHYNTFVSSSGYGCLYSYNKRLGTLH